MHAIGTFLARNGGHGYVPTYLLIIGKTLGKRKRKDLQTFIELVLTETICQRRIEMELARDGWLSPSNVPIERKVRWKGRSEPTF